MPRTPKKTTALRSIGNLSIGSVRSATTLLIVIALAGCMTAEEMRKQHQAKCSGYGLRPGTAQFTTCMMQLDKQAQRESECSDAYWGAFSTADPAKGAGYGFGVAAQAKANCMAGLPVQPAAPPQPTYKGPSNTNCTTSGNTLNCVHF